MRPGKLIVLEGIDGSGKSTQVEKIVESPFGALGDRARHASRTLGCAASSLRGGPCHAVPE
ncbi:hypothetical protein CKO25_11415 [Thiocapsa imhoffii]|uniref:Thymidylate kinase-like domain-containing protein n=1 Tax=Thiocapsa imhoffii TaxID=382777 RepID=A0A9X0WIA9_9GAMM|nr:hypothetical protein [Thiocapsa imhoffii]MBK1645239.1 hypothetical protein [Thiocapsa imhoffii]